MDDANEREDILRRAFVWDDSSSSTSESESEDDATHYRVFRCQLCGQAIGEGSKSKKSNSRALVMPCGHQFHKKCLKKHKVKVPGDCPVVRCKKSGKVDPATWIKLRGGTTEISRWANEDNESLRERLRDAERQVRSLIEQNESLMRNTPRTEMELRERELKIAIDEAVRLRKELDELQATATALADRNRVLLLAHEGKEEPTPEELVEDAYAIEKEKRDFDMRFDAENRAIRDRRYQQFEEALRENDTSFEQALSAISRARSFNHIEDHRVMMLLDLDRQAEEREITLTEILDGLDVVPVLGGVELPVAMQMIGLNSRLEQLSISYEDIFELLNNETERARITARRLQRQAEAKPSTSEEPVIDEQPEAIKIEAVEQPIENEKPPTPSVVIPVLSPEVISNVNRRASLSYESVEDLSTPNSGKNSEVSPPADERVSRRATRKRTSESASAESSASKKSRNSDISDDVLIASLKLCLERASRDNLRGEIQRLLDMRGVAENDAKSNPDESENLIRKTLLEAKVKKQESTPKLEKRPADAEAGTPASGADSSLRKSESRSSRKSTTAEGSSSKKSTESSTSKSGVSGVESIKRSRSRSSSSSSSDSSSSSSSPPKRPRRKAAAKREAPAKKKSVSKKKKPTPPKKKPAAKKKAPAQKRTTKEKSSTKEEPSVEKEITPERVAEGVQTRSKTRSESKSVEEGEVTQSSQEVLELVASPNEVEDLAASTPPPPPSGPAPAQPPPPPSPVLRDQAPGIAQANPQERARLELIEREAQFRHNIEEMMREFDRQNANAQAGYMEPMPIEECFTPPEQ
ncbi:pinin-like [Planococcus citri]|uniref:pinin-like n=1 Tax=Planococcus citri TaxID=170843 RepID=UPI0031F8A449